MNTNEKREEFKIRLAGVVPGNYSYSICCDDTFFEIAEISRVQSGHLDLQINVEKTEKLMKLNFHFEGDITAPCDRCLDPVTLNMDFDELLIVNLVAMVDQDFENDENIWMIDENDYELDLFHFVYETITLAIPHRILHPDDSNGHSQCNTEVLKTLKKLSSKGKKTNNEIDPRWEALKNLKIDEKQ